MLRKRALRIRAGFINDFLKLPLQMDEQEKIKKKRWAISLKVGRRRRPKCYEKYFYLEEQVQTTRKRSDKVASSLSFRPR